MTDKIRLLIVEDEITLAEDIALRLTEVGYLIIGICNSYDEAFDKLKSNKVDFAIIDISLKGNKDGIQLAETINNQFKIPFLFLTSHSDELIINRAKAVGPHAFMLKPFNNRQLHVAIEMAITNYTNLPPELVDNSNHEISNEDKQVLQLKGCLFLKKRDSYFERVNLDKILWLEASSNYTTIHTSKGKFTYSIVLKNIDKKLPHDKFIRVHRSYIVNIENITGFEGNILCIGNKEIPVSKAHRDELFKKFMVI